MAEKKLTDILLIVSEYATELDKWNALKPNCRILLNIVSESNYVYNDFVSGKDSFNMRCGKKHVAQIISDSRIDTLRTNFLPILVHNPYVKKVKFRLFEQEVKHDELFKAMNHYPNAKIYTFVKYNTSIESLIKFACAPNPTTIICNDLIKTGSFSEQKLYTSYQLEQIAAVLFILQKYPDVMDQIIYLLLL